MNQLKLKEDTDYTIDLKGVAVINRKSGFHFFIEYPEAAVWSVLRGSYNIKAVEKLMAILKKNKFETSSYINKCLTNWKKSNIID